MTCSASKGIVGLLTEDTTASKNINDQYDSKVSSRRTGMIPVDATLHDSFHPALYRLFLVQTAVVWAGLIASSMLALYRTA